MGQKLSSKLLFIYSPNSDGFYIFYISQGSVATQLRCDDMFSNQFITNFPLNAPVEKFWESVNIWQTYGQKFVAYFLGHPVYDGGGREEWQAWKIGTVGKGGKETERAKERWEGGGKSRAFLNSWIHPPVLCILLPYLCLCTELSKTTINDVNVVIYLSLCRAAKRAFRLVSADVTKSDAITLIWT